jgi:hypothetical protein
MAKKEGSDIGGNQGVGGETGHAKAKPRTTPNHFTRADLEEKDRFQMLSPDPRRLLNMIRMINYRAETAMAGLLVGPTVRSTAP